jgi:DUF971 family protein
MNDQYTATKIVVSQEDQALSVTWADGHISTYSLDGLRRACPCATCQGGHENMGRPVDPIIFKLPALQTWKIDRIEPRGHYALQIYWADGHNAGIYGWERLRQMCPCEECFS